MADKRDIFRFVPEGGMNWDDSDYALPEGDYRSAHDLLMSHAASGNVGAGTLVPGTAAYGIPLPAGNNKTISYYEDRGSQRGIVFNWNESKEHGIYLLTADHAVPAIPVLVHPLLNFSPEHPITGVAVYHIYKDGVKQTLLFYTDNYNDPRCINLDTIGSVPRAQLEERFINLAKCPPLIAPALDPSYTGVAGSFDKGLVQMIYRYVYKDFQESAWSPVSRPLSAAWFENGLQTIKASIAGDVLDFATGGADQRYWRLIDSVEVAVRFSAREPFRRWARIKPNGQTIGPLEFKNDGAYPAVADISWLKNYDAVPHRAIGLAGIDNRVVLGGLTENFPEHTLALSGVGTRSYPHTQITGDRMAFKNGSSYQLGIVYFDQAGRTPGAYTSELLKVTPPVEFTRDLPTRHAKVFKLDSKPPVWAHSYQVVRTEALDKAWFVQGIVDDVSYIRTLPDAGVDQKPTVIRRRIGTAGIWDGSSWKTETGSTSVGSSMRRTGITSNHEKYFPGTPIYEGGVNAEGQELVVIRTDYNGFGKDHNELRDEPIGRTETGKFIYFGGYDKAPSATTRVPVIEYMSAAELGDAKYLGLNIRNWSASSPKSSTESYPSNEIYYNFEKGDRVDLLYSQAGAYLGVLSLRIEDLRDNMLIVPVTSGLLPQANKPLGRGLLIEVFKPRGRDQEPLFYEYGESYKVLNPGAETRSHGKLEFEVYMGDVHLINKPQYGTGYATSTSFPVMSMHPDPSKTFEFWERGHGRALLPARQGVRVSPNELRYSHKVLSDGQVNGTSSFDALNGHTYPSEYGDLTLLVPAQNNMVQDTGNILLAQFRNETVSIYVNRNTLQDLSGRTQVLESDKVLGSYNTLLGSFGLWDAQASVGVDSRRYWWDDYKGVAVRYSRDGLTAISKIKMHSYFQALSQRGLKAIAGYDNANDMFFLTIGNQTITWDEGANRWRQFLSFAPELYGQLGNKMLSFVDGVPYLHGPGAWNTFYGTHWQPRLALLFNARPNAGKELQQLCLLSDHAWDTVLESSNPSGTRRQQMTRIEPAAFAANEENWEASVPRDHYSPNIPEAERPINGIKLMSNRVYVSLVGAVPAGESSSLYEVALDYTDSKPQPLGDK